MALTESRRRANDKYIKKAIRRFVLRLNKITEPEVVEYLEGIENKTDYLRQLILDDMKKNR